MLRDIRGTDIYQEAETIYRSLRQPGGGQISDAVEINLAPDGKRAAFAGIVLEKLEGVPPTRLFQIDLESGHTQALTFGPNTDRLPKYSPSGECIAFLSDRHQPGDFQLYLLDPASGAIRPVPPVDGWVEYLHWSADGTRILLGVAGRGADTSSAQGSMTSPRAAEDVQSWMPVVETGNESFRWRGAWVYELSTNSVRQVSCAGCNVWEAVWCGNESLAAVVSPAPGEGHWYSARLHIINVRDGTSDEVFTPRDQLGWPAASPSGRHLAIVQAICSDRWFVAGDLHLVDTASGQTRRVDTAGVDVTYTEWRSEQHLLLAGHRGFATAVGVYDVVSGRFAEVWSSTEITVGGPYITVSGFGEPGDCVLIGESFIRAPEIAMLREGQYTAVKSFARSESDTRLASEEPIVWKAPDGLEIQGWLLRPRSKGPHPAVMSIHGGPVGHSRQRWLGRTGLSILLLLAHGYAVFLPNPRGSVGRGQSFVRHVVGEMGGADTYDCLSGLDHLVTQGIADPKRLGVTGGSYGGFMTSWLVTQDSRFAAAVAVAPFNNPVTQHLISSLPHFVSLFLADHYTNLEGKYFQRSPIMHAHRVKTPTLNICGALDRATPPQEAMQFHSALLENGVKSVLLTYPEEGHGIRKLPAALDYAARVVSWFEEHMPAG